MIPVQDKRELNEKKKNYLQGYRRSIRKAKRIEAELEEIRNMKENPGVVNNDGMPHGTNVGDLSNYAAELCELEESLYQEGVEQVKEYRTIMASIDQLENEEERDVLFYRYIKGKDFWSIGDTMGYSERQIHRIHGNALSHLKI